MLLSERSTAVFFFFFFFDSCGPTKSLVFQHFCVFKVKVTWQTYSQVWWPILGILHLPIQCAHTLQWTHTRSSGQPFMLRHPGSIWGFGALQEFEIHLFTRRTSGGLICNFYRRFKLMLQKEKPCIKRKLLNRMKMCTFFLFCLNIIFVYLVLPFRRYRRCFPEDNII